MVRREWFVVLATVGVVLVATAGQRGATAQTTPASGGAVDAALIEDLVIANRILAQEGILDAYGHVSLRHPENPSRYLLARSLAPILVTAGDIMEYDLESTPIDPQGRASVVERFIHGEIYKARPDVHAVIHSHSPSVVPFSITEVPLGPVFHMASFLWVGVPVWDIRAVDDPTAAALLVRNGPVGRSLATALADKPVVLMRGHGNVVVGPDVRTAVSRAIYTEVNARLLTTALGLGGPITYISAEEGVARDDQPGDPGRGWDLWRRQALGR